MKNLKLHQAKPLLHILHNSVPGRRRYKVRGLQRSKNLGQYLELRLSREPEIDSVRASSWSGNIVIVFSKERNHKAITSLIQTIVNEYRQEPKQAIKLIHNWSQAPAK